MNLTIPLMALPCFHNVTTVEVSTLFLFKSIRFIEEIWTQGPCKSIESYYALQVLYSRYLINLYYNVANPPLPPETPILHHKT